jgi:cobalt-zinc-cadmium efflux system outer membrane protein
MSTRYVYRLAPAVVALVWSGCASVPKRGGMEEVDKEVERRTGHRVHWDQGDPEDAQVADQIRQLVKAPLTLDSAVELALLNNRGLQATFEELGIAQADLVQAGRIRNPSIGVGILFPVSAGAVTGLNFSVAQEFLDLLTLPLRKRVASAQFDQAKLRVTDAVLQLAAEARFAYLNVQAAQQMTALWRTIGEAAQASSELATRQHEAGNISDLTFANQRGAYEQAKLDLARSEADELSARERLTRVLGLWGLETDWKVVDQLPELPRSEISLEHLEAAAIAQRVDLEVARREAQAIAFTLSLARGTRWVGSVALGANGGRDPEGTWSVGPSLQIELPIFDQQQARLARLEAVERQSQQRVLQLAVEIRSEARATRNRLVATRQVVEHYRTVLLPLRERITALSQQQYDSMLLGVYQLLAAKQMEVTSYREYIEAVRDYWIARSDLERVVGGRLTVPPDTMRSSALSGGTNPVLPVKRTSETTP